VHMIVLDREQCSGCGMCALVCHNRCVDICGGMARIDDALCDHCAQCVAVCSQMALSWADVSPVRVDETRLPSPDQLDELFKERRSIRFFKGDRIDRRLLREVVGYGAYAPTNNHDLRVVVVDNREIIETLEWIVVQSNERVYRLLFKPGLVFALLHRIAPDVNPKVRAKLERRRCERFNPAAMVFVVGDARIALSEASAQAALDLMMLYAQVQGIGSCLWGAGRMILDRSREARDRLGLHERERILGVLLLGYPAVTFRNKVEGRTLPVAWNGECESSERD
jgi:nitroreductase/NAD-dependent dihydropyrimidine dehydrogenase PreA subunit